MISSLIISTSTLLDICDFNTEDVGGWKDLSSSSLLLSKIKTMWPGQCASYTSLTDSTGLDPISTRRLMTEEKQGKSAPEKGHYSPLGQECHKIDVEAKFGYHKCTII